MTQDNISEEFERYASIVRLGGLLDDEMRELISKFLGVANTASDKVDAIKAVIETYEYAKDQKLHRALADLEKEMILVQREATSLMREADTLDREKLDLERENQKLKDQIEQLKSGQSQIELVQKNGFYYKSDGEGPFCQSCSTKSSQYVALSPLAGFYKCPQCQTLSGT